MTKKPVEEQKERHSETRYLRILAEQVTADTFRAIIKKAVEQALAGDAAARLFLTAFLCGMPHGSAPKLSLLDSLDQNDKLMEQLIGGVL
ncbi:MAG: hypothetical protein VB050_08155 [Geobacteraceae bacterium]|nr:hypothetical protein [Geobacteraceae bacterium]